MSRTAARGALRALLLRVPGLPEDRAWQCRDYRPVTGTPFVRETLQFPEGAKVALGPGGLVRQPFLYFVDIFYPKTTLLLHVDSMIDAFEQVFYPGQKVLAAGVSGYVTGCAAVTVRPDAQWHHAPLTVRGWYMVAAPTG